MNLAEIIERIASQLERLPYIHAMWLEGSYATGKYHKRSDIDVWLDVDDGTFDQSVESFRKYLQRVGKIDYEEARGIYSADPKLAKHIFHLDGFPEEQTIELDLQEHSREFVFTKTQHMVKIVFDKDQTIKWEVE